MSDVSLDSGLGSDGGGELVLPGVRQHGIPPLGPGQVPVSPRPRVDRRARCEWCRQPGARYRTKRGLFCGPECSREDQEQAAKDAYKTVTERLRETMPGVHAEKKADIRACRRCGNRILQETSVGFHCHFCGILWFARDGDWEQEASRTQEVRDWSGSPHAPDYSDSYVPPPSKVRRALARAGLHVKPPTKPRPLVVSPQKALAKGADKKTSVQTVVQSVVHLPPSRPVNPAMWQISHKLAESR